MNNYKGVIIEESLEDKAVLKKVTIVSTRVSEVTPRHKTPWVTRWTLHAVEIAEDQAGKIAEELSRALDPEHAWYVDFKNQAHHFIIFRDKIFFIDRRSAAQYDAARQYGIALGIPEYQVNFLLEVIK